eukprot:TRINITY_DN110668_c0_g1_i1.p1 TRINITY_DN110668_c0_g1~~TRINITY_DN110668_c0_g1_i1.p1  ORF type:complete len:453 (+),score=64.37 TRINITY_DN110668_c0_g1_i1:114-1472(+)
MDEATEPVKVTSHHPGQQLDGPRKSLRGQVVHKRTCGNKLLFLELQPEPGTGSQEFPGIEEDKNQHRGLEAIFSFEVYGQEVRALRKAISVGDVVSCEGTWRTCGRILDVFSFSHLAHWADIGGGAPFQVPSGAGEHGRKPNSGAEEHDAPPANKMRRRRSGSDRLQLCKFWMSNGQCQKNDCGCDHPEGEELRTARGLWAERLLQKRVASANPDDPHREEDKKCHASRAAVFAEWICEVFGPIEELRARGGVLEVAGGRGELAFELSVKRQIPCTVLDPRCPGGGQPAAPWHGWHVSRPQRHWLKSLGSGLRSYSACQEHVANSPLRQCQATVAEALAAAAEDASPESGSRSSSWKDVLSKCQVIVGLHPDQATGGVLELAGMLGRPFAVVPCCTFADDFPGRLLEDGRAVRTYDDLVQWLQFQGGPTAKKDFLQFVGKNLVVYRTSGSGS